MEDEELLVIRKRTAAFSGGKTTLVGPCVVLLRVRELRRQTTSKQVLDLVFVEV